MGIRSHRVRILAMLASALAVVLAVVAGPVQAGASGVPGWRVQTVISVPRANVYLHAVAAVSAADAWAVGSVTSRVTFESTPVVLGGNDVWAMGSVGPAPYAARFTGRRWIVTSVPSTTGITDATAVSKKDIWAVTENAVVRWNGRRRRTAAVGVRLAPRLVLLGSVYARSDGDVWVGGAAVNDQNGKTEAAAHYNGRFWRVTYLPAVHTPASYELTSVVPDGRGGLWALGFLDPQLWRLWHERSGSWQAATANVSHPSDLAGLAGSLAWVPGRGSVWAAGGIGYFPNMNGMIMLYGPVPG